MYKRKESHACGIEKHDQVKNVLDDNETDVVCHLSWRLRNSIIQGYTCFTACIRNSIKKASQRKQQCTLKKGV